MIESQLFPIEQNIKLSENSDTWAESITTVLSRKYPDIAKYLDKIVFQKVEKVKGYAVGYAALAKEGLRVPFIIENFTLLPMDVFIRDNRYGYLNRESAARLASTTWPFGNSVRVGETIGMNKVAAVSLTDMTEEQINADENLLKLAAVVGESNPGVIQSLSDNMGQRKELADFNGGNVGCEKIAHMEISKDGTRINLVHFGAKDEEFTLKTASERFGSEAIKQLLELGIIRKPMQNLHITTAELPAEQWHDNKDADTRYPRTLNLSDGYGGFLRGNIYEIYDVKNPENKRGMVFLSTKSKHPYYDVLSPYNKDKKLYNTADFGLLDELVDDLNRPAIDLKPGMAAAILMNNTIYGPFDVRSESNMGGERIFSILDGYDADIYRLHLTTKVKTIVADGDDIFVPITAKLIYLGKPVSQMPMEKTAALSVRVMPTADKQHFNVIDNGVTGIPATGLQNLPKTKAITALMHAGLSENEAGAAVMASLTKGSHEFKATPTAGVSEQQTRQMVQQDLPRLQKTASTIREIIDFSGLVKIAIDLGGDENVDLALGLRMITPETIRRYRLLIPRIEDTIDGLCKLMLAKRLGGNQVPLDENKVKACVSALTDIECQLTGV